MIPLFLGLTLFNLVCLVITGALGYQVSSGNADAAPFHQLAGVLTTVACVAVHCVVFTYFMATSKWVAHAVLVKRLDSSLALRTGRFKVRAFPAALLAMTSVFVCAVVGAATFSYRIAPTWHHVLAIASLLINVGSAVIEYFAIRDNGILIDGILDRVNRQGMISSTEPPGVAERQTLRT